MLRGCYSLLVGHFGPDKKIFSPPPRKIPQFAADTLPAPRPLPSWRNPPRYMREMGAICQIGVLTWKPCTFWVQNALIFGLFALRFQ